MAKEIFLLKIYSALLTVVILILTAIVISLHNREHIEELNIERINIVEADGKLRMVISNKARQHPGVMDSIVFSERVGQRPPGLMFFGENGNEVGGLIFDGNAGKGQGGSLTFDKFRGDQTVQLSHEEDSQGNYFAGLKINDQNLPLIELLKKEQEIKNLPTKSEQDTAWQQLRSDGLLMTERFRIGRDQNKSSIIKMRDDKGRVRIELKVEAKGNPQINLFDENGKTIYSIPHNTSR